MQTIRYKEVGKKKIITGFDALQVDPVATRNKALEAVGKTDIIERITKAKEDVQEAANVKDMFKKVQIVKGLQDAYNKAFKKLLRANPVYFECRRNEQIISEKALKDIKKALEKADEDHVVTVDGKLIKKPRE